MSELMIHTAKLVPYTKRPKQAHGYTTAFCYEPDVAENTQSVSNLYIVVEVLIPGRAGEDIADLIIENFGEAYYNTPSVDKDDTAARFDAAVKAVNNNLARCINNGNAAWVGKLSAVIAIISEKDIHLTHTGSAEAFLYRDKATSHITKNRQNRNGTPLKTFDSIASGELEIGDHFLFATPALTHQVSLDKLRGIISDSTPNAAIDEIASLLKGTSTDRIAALVLETTTAEIAAMRFRSEQPNELQLSATPSFIDIAKITTIPIAQTTLESSRRFTQVARKKLIQSPSYLTAVKNLKLKRKVIIPCLAAILILGGSIGIIAFQKAGAQHKALSDYQTQFDNFIKAKEVATVSPDLGEERLSAIQKRLETLKSSQKYIDTHIGKAAQKENLPNFASFQKQIVAELDKLQDIAHYSPTLLSGQSAEKTAGLMVRHKDNLYVFDTQNHNTVYIINTQSGTKKISPTQLAKIGAIKSIALSGQDDGIFILTDTPSVWFYDFASDSSKEQKLSIGQWPQSSAIAAYDTNIYLLSDNTIYKHLKNATGFSPKLTYLKGSSTGSIKTIAIDGSVYTVSETTLAQYTAGQMTQKTDLPARLDNITRLYASEGSSAIIGIDDTSHLIGLWSTRGNKLTLLQKIALANIREVYSASYDSVSKTLYASTDLGLVKTTIKY